MSDGIVAEKRWLGSTPTVCQLCEGEFERVMIDGRSGPHPFSPWGLVCLGCFERQTGNPWAKVGLGYGQMYVLNEEGDWILVAGGGPDDD